MKEIQNYNEAVALIEQKIKTAEDWQNPDLQKQLTHYFVLCLYYFASQRYKYALVFGFGKPAVGGLMVFFLKEMGYDYSKDPHFRTKGQKKSYSYMNAYNQPNLPQERQLWYQVGEYMIGDLIAKGHIQDFISKLHEMIQAKW